MSEQYNQDGSVRNSVTLNAVRKYNWVMLLVAVVLAGVAMFGMWNNQPSPTPDTDNQRQSVVCPECNGTKMTKPPELWIKYHPEDDKLFPCSMCGGTGVMYYESRSDNGVVILRNSP